MEKGPNRMRDEDDDGDRGAHNQQVKAHGGISWPFGQQAKTLLSFTLFMFLWMGGTRDGGGKLGKIVLVDIKSHI